MLKKTATEGGKNWDKMIPYLLFAYWEVPQASTRFSPFELLYCRDVRGPLDVLWETWEAGKQNDDNVISYILSMREKLDDMSDLVKQNLLKEQSRQKSWYERNAQLREFKEGDPVLVLLLTSTQKLLAQWQGPYQVVKRTGRVTYLTDMHDKRKRRRIFHVNMLKAFQVRQQDNNCYVEEDIEAEETEIPVWNDNPPGESTIGRQLTEPQKQELGKLLTKYGNAFSNKAGRTNLVTHHIKTGDMGPIRLPPYRLPYAYREQVVKELAEMLENGIIEELSSDWASPIVLVP